MNKVKLGVVAGSLAAGFAASALAWVVGAIAILQLLARSAQNSAEFDASAFLQQTNGLIYAAMLGCGLVTFLVCLKHQKK